MKNKRTELIYYCAINFFFLCFPTTRGWTAAWKGSRRESRCPTQVAALKELNLKKRIFSKGWLFPLLQVLSFPSHTLLHVETQPYLLWCGGAGSNVWSDQGAGRTHDSNEGTADHRMLQNTMLYPYSYLFGLGLFTVSVQPLILIMVALNISKSLPFPNSNANVFKLMIMYSCFFAVL